MKRTLLISFLIGITIYSVFQYIMSAQALKQAKTQVSALEIERQQLIDILDKERGLNKVLNQKNILFKDNLKASINRILKINKDLSKAEERVNKLSFQTSILKEENKVLRKERERYRGQLEVTSREKAQLDEKFNSISELKKAISELKKGIRKNFTKNKNGGYIIKDGKSTQSSSPQVKIEVIPTSAKK